MAQTIYIGADHAGFEAKKNLKHFLIDQGHHVEDLGAHTLDEADDYPKYAFTVAEQVVAEPERLGILLCGSGQGVCLAANKVPGVRAVSSWSPEHAASTRTDENANVLCLAARYLDQPTLEAIAARWLSTPFTADERHVRRLKQISAREA